jgi:hypothetical protein
MQRDQYNDWCLIRYVKAVCDNQIRIIFIIVMNVILQGYYWSKVGF